MSLLKFQSALQTSRDLVCRGACLLGPHRAVTRRRHLHAGLAASDKGVKAVGFQYRSHKLFRKFLVRASRTHPCARAHGRPIMGFSPSSPPPSRTGCTTKKPLVSRATIVGECSAIGAGRTVNSKKCFITTVRH
ncbi:hypothetical protein EVAR_89238_1 [Eumeta japonica]|uniref:Uncharacterized protein n=1 Tax=Eumeta variegata TaxID=151549 RepID=A0A4C1VJ56_EUMVA|nr:hypothetical protein EVAR_89238_1 [Eumeta japonica]